MKYAYITFTLLIICFLNVNAQNSQQTAIQYYRNAKEALQNNEPQKCLSNIDNIIGILGKTNIKVQPLKIRALYQIKDYQSIINEVPNYLALNPDKKWAEYAEIINIQKQSEIKLKQEKRDYQVLYKNATINLCENFISNYPKSIYTDKVKNIKYDLEEDKAWEAAKYANTINSYYKYVDAYDDQSKYYNAAMNAIDQLDKEAYNSAVKTHSLFSYNYYLDKYSRGKYREDIQSRKSLLEEDIFYHSVENGSVSKLKSYLSKYPEGRYLAQVKEQLDQKYHTEIDKSVSLANFQECKDLCLDYQNTLESNAYNQNMLKKANLGLKKQANKKKRDSYPNKFLADYTWMQNCNLGISMGSLKNKNIGYYYSIVGSDNLYGELSEDDIDGDKVRLNSNFTLGLTKKLFRPFWLVAGAGVGASNVYFNTSDENFSQEEYDEYEDLGAQFVWEYGAVVSIKFINVSVKRIKYAHGWENVYSVGFSL